MGPPHTCGSGRFEELSNLIRTIRNAMKIRDVTRCLEEFELLGRAYAKARGVLDKEGVPRFYVRLLADLEDYLNEVWGRCRAVMGWLWGCCGAALWHFITSLWGYMGSYGPAPHIYGSTPHLWVWQVRGAVQPDPTHFYRVMS